MNLQSSFSMKKSRSIERLFFVSFYKAIRCIPISYGWLMASMILR